MACFRRRIFSNELNNRPFAHYVIASRNPQCDNRKRNANTADDVIAVAESLLGVQKNFVGNFNSPLICQLLLVPVCRQKFSTKFNSVNTGERKTGKNILRRKIPAIQYYRLGKSSASMLFVKGETPDM